jgi:hypothetical protein
MQWTLFPWNDRKKIFTFYIPVIWGSSVLAEDSDRWCCQKKDILFLVHHNTKYQTAPPPPGNNWKKTPKSVIYRESSSNIILIFSFTYMDTSDRLQILHNSISKMTLTIHHTRWHNTMHWQNYWRRRRSVKSSINNKYDVIWLEMRLYVHHTALDFSRSKFLPFRSWSTRNISQR